MLRSVVQHVAPLAERPDVAVPASATCRVMIEMGRRQHHLGRPKRYIIQARRGDLTTSTVAPGLLFLVPPAAIAQVVHGRAMWPATDLAAPLGAHERPQWLICGQSIG